MTNEKSFTIPDTVLAAHLEDEAVLLDMDSKQYFRLNGTAAFIWKALERGLPHAKIVEDLTETFDVAEAEAAAELDRLLNELTGAGLLTTANAAE